MKTPFITKEKAEEIIKQYPTPFHIYDEKENGKVSLGNMKKISWKVVSVKTGNVLEDSSSEIKAGISQNEAANVRNFASEFAMHIQKVINQKS